MRTRFSAAIAIAIVGLLPIATRAQTAARDTARLRVTTTANGVPVPDVVLRAGRAGALTDTAGRATLTLPAGLDTVVATKIGYRPETTFVVLAAGADTAVAIDMTSQAATIAPVFVTTTRTERRVEEEPLRVEVLAGEDVSEKTLARPADLRTLLTEMSGVRVQTTSSSLGAASLQIQGLRGRYTAVLSDGLPLYGAQPGGFGLLQIPPLDIRQVEVIKGAASALYGPSALGGVVNLISRRPPDTNDVVVNQTARGGSDVVAFGTTQGRTSTRLSVIGGLHSQRLSDPYHDGWATLPGYRRAEIRPRLYWSDSTGRALFVTVGGTTEKRGGGSVSTFGPAGGVFPESLTTAHGDIGATGRFPLNESLSFAMRVSADIDGRHRQFGNARESERRSTAFSEVTSTLVGGSNVLLGGVALQHDSYRNADAPSFDDGVTTPAVFVQHTYTPSSWFATQVNGRCDASSRWGTICTPRLSLLAHAGRVVSARLSGGSGWYGPAALYEDTEEIGLTRLSATSFFALSPERARTASLDLSTAQGPFEVSGTLFASSIKNAVGLRSLAPGSTPSLAFWNAPGPTQAHGGEVFAVYNQEPVAVTAYYAATRTREISPETGALRETPLVPRETAGLDVAFQEDESGTRVGVELFYSGRQALEENPYRAISRPYTTVGLLAAKIIGRAQLYVNADNLTNVRQTRFDPLLRSRPDERGRWTVEEWAPLEGRSLNVGVRVRY